MGRLAVFPGRRARSRDLWQLVAQLLAVRSPTTQETYAGIFHEFFNFLGVVVGDEEGAKRIMRITDEDAIKYRLWLEDRPGEKPRHGGSSKLSNATIAKKLAAIRKLFSFLVTQDFLRKNPFSRELIPPPPRFSGRKRPTEMIKFDLVKKLLDAPDSKTEKGRRDRALLAALFGGGLRRGEIVNLRVSDVRKTEGGDPFLYLRATKIGKDARQAIPPWAFETIEKWSQELRAKGVPGTSWLIPRFTGPGGQVPTDKQLSGTGLYKTFKHYAQVIGAGEFATPHSARATAITKLLDEGINYRKVKDFSRHSSVQMVEVYDKRLHEISTSVAKRLTY